MSDTKTIVVGASELAGISHVPDRPAPIEVATPLKSNPSLIAITRAAAAWAARCQASSPATPPRPTVTIGVSGRVGASLYVPGGVARNAAWSDLLVAPKDQETNNSGEAGIFKPGVRGLRSHMPADVRAAREAARACLQTPQSGAIDFRALLSPAATIVNAWRFGPGALAIDFMIGADAQHFNNECVCMVNVTDATLREAYVPAGGFYKPIGARVSLTRTADTEIKIVLDLKHAHRRATFLRVIVAWELSIAGARRQCLVAMRAPNALPAPGLGAVFAGGSVVGTGSYPAAAGMVYSFCKASVPGTVAAVSPEGHSVFVAEMAKRSALYGEGAPFVLDIGSVDLDVSEFMLMLSVVPVGEWMGEADNRSTLTIELNLNGSWVTFATYSFSALAAHLQSYPALAGAGRHPAMSDALAVNKYQFSPTTPMATTPVPPPARPVVVLATPETYNPPITIGVGRPVTIPERPNYTLIAPVPPAPVQTGVVWHTPAVMPKPEPKPVSAYAPPAPSQPPTQTYASGSWDLKWNPLTGRYEHK